MTTIKKRMFFAKIILVEQNVIKNVRIFNFSSDDERISYCKNNIEMFFYSMNYDYNVFHNTLLYFNNLSHLLDKLPPPYDDIVSKIKVSHPVNNTKTCFLHMFYKNNYFTIHIEDKTKNKSFQILFYNDTVVIPLIN